MSKPQLKLKSLFLPLFILVSLLVGRKYIKEAGLTKLQLLPSDEVRLTWALQELGNEIDRVRILNHEIYDSLERRSNLKSNHKIDYQTLKKDFNVAYHQINHDFSYDIIQYSGGIDEQGFYINPFARIQFGEPETDSLYKILDDLQYKYSLNRNSEIKVDNQGYNIRKDDFRLLYCNAPHLILLTNIRRLELRIAKLEYQYLRYIVQENGIKFPKI
jgi:hypothetical protein